MSWISGSYFCRFGGIIILIFSASIGSSFAQEPVQGSAEQPDEAPDFRPGLLPQSYDESGVNLDSKHFPNSGGEDNPFTIQGKEPEFDKNIHELWGLALSPFVSFVLPGFDQWWEGQTTWAGIYTGSAVAAVMASSYYAAAFSNENSSSERQEEFDSGLLSRDSNYRRLQYAGQIYQTIGGFSAYHSFRTAVRKHHPEKFGFIKAEDTPQDILLAPFDFKYMTRASTWVPLAIVSALTLYQIHGTDEELRLDDNYVLRKRGFTSEDAFFTAGQSFNAGTHEEAVFRGWIMPMAHEYTGSALAARLIDASLFALAHLSTVDIPIVQLAFGYHLADMTQNNGYSLLEAAFVHTWWDVIAFYGIYHFERVAKPKPAKLSGPAPIFWLPGLTLIF